MKKREMR
jgi:hypothetical protein